MNKKLAIGTSLLLGTFVLNPAVMPLAHADIVSTQQIVAEKQSGLDRMQLAEQLQRVDVQEQLVRYGVNPVEAIARVNAMTDAEVQQLTAGIEELPAGSAATVILLVLVIWLLLR
ncbi:MAG: PA2779 family protein [Idiomarina sp.]|nr:PA2779 family protein [Idiomarina sp.]